MTKETEVGLKVGDAAPDFAVSTQNGNTVSLGDFRGKRVILYFYPKDNTPGCTVEACGFRNRWQELQQLGVVVLGVSTDSATSHERFAKRFELPFPLLADVDRTVATTYGAWGMKSFMGKKYMGMHRITFLLGPDGRIQHIWTKVKTAKHAEEVLAFLRQAP